MRIRAARYRKKNCRSVSGSSRAGPKYPTVVFVIDGWCDRQRAYPVRSVNPGRLLCRNPRDSDTPNRAVRLIDRVAGSTPLGPGRQRAFLAQLGAIVTTPTQQTRYDTADLLPAGDEKVFNRFMPTPTRGSA